MGGDHSNHTGVLLHYSGGTWTSVPPPSVSTDWEPYGVYFTSSDEGWAAGYDNINHRGALLHYSGGTWISVPPPTVSTNWWLSGVYLTSPTEGWAVGADDSNHVGVLLHFGYVISPKAGTIGTEITITSSGFGTRKGKVLIATTSLKILDWSDGLIRCLLSRALPPDTYDLTIRPQARGSSPIIIENAFTVKAPEILSVDPSHGAQGAGSTIRGNFFGTKKGKVTLGGKTCKVLRWTMDPTTGVSEIDFVVPKRLDPGTYELIVTTTKVGSDTADFTVE